MLRYLRGVRAIARAQRLDPEHVELAKHLREQGLTFLSLSRLCSLILRFHEARALTATPKILEFGSGAGGSAILLASLCKKFGGTLTLFDLFARIPQPGPMDGEKARKRFDAIMESTDPNYYGNVKDLQSLVAARIEEFAPGFAPKFIAGDFRETVPKFKPRAPVNLVHLDGDWYESTKVVLDAIQNKWGLSGSLQIDDYSDWPGCKKAVDESGILVHPHQLLHGALVVRMDS